MTLELVKYPYGLVTKYTAFCLTPVSKHKTAEGSSVIANRLSRHYETPSGVLGYLRSSGHKLSKLDFCPLPGTAIRRRV